MLFWGLRMSGGQPQMHRSSWVSTSLAINRIIVCFEAKGLKRLISAPWPEGSVLKARNDPRHPYKDHWLWGGRADRSNANAVVRIVSFLLPLNRPRH